MTAPLDGIRQRVSPLGVAAALLGVALFGWALAQTGLQTIADGIRRLGGWFAVLVALAGLRFWLRAQAWTLATEGPTPLRLREAFPALVAGDAMGNLTPLGVFLSETVKAAFVRPRIRLMSAVAGIAVENLFYIFTVVLVIGGGTLSLLWLFEIGDTLRHIATIALTMILIGSAIAGFLVIRQPKLMTGSLEWLGRSGRVTPRISSRLDKLRVLEEQIYGFAKRHPARVGMMLALELGFHVLGVLEMWITLAILAGESTPTLLSAFVLESVNRTIMVVFKFVPLRLGVDEIGTELLTRTLGLPVGIGVTMAVIRKARMILWAAVGVTFLLRRGLRPTTLVAESRE